MHKKRKKLGLKSSETSLPAPYTVRVASQVVGKASWGSAHPLVGWAPPTFSTNGRLTPMTHSPCLTVQRTPCMAGLGPNSRKKNQFSSHLPSQLTQILLTKGGVQPNPGPGYQCGVCGFGAGANSFKCSGCRFWVHICCSLLPSSRTYTGENSRL